jgi:hypothetical protein
MLDADTVELIARAPPLEGLDLAQLPQTLTEVYAQIVAARVRLRGLTAGEALPDAVTNAIQTMRRIASAHEAFVSTLPAREDRSAAAFVAANRLPEGPPSPSRSLKADTSGRLRCPTPIS